MGKERYCGAVIDVAATGAALRKRAEAAGLGVKDIQISLGLLSPQPVYRWFGGRRLPSVDNLYALSVMFGVHMEELLVFEAAADEADSRRQSVEIREADGLAIYIMNARRAAAF